MNLIKNTQLKHLLYQEGVVITKDRFKSRQEWVYKDSDDIRVNKNYIFYSKKWHSENK
jgi:hypothetical protein